MKVVRSRFDRLTRSGVTLRLYRGPDMAAVASVGQRDRSRWTLRDVFDQVLRPTNGGRWSKSTLWIYLTALTHWEELSENPPVSETSKKDVTLWLEALLKAEAIGSPATVNKYWRHLRAIFRCVGPEGELAEPLLRVVPKVKPLREPAKVPREVSLEMIDSVYRACDKFEFTQPFCLALDERRWAWRTTCISFLLHGQRTWDVLWAEWADIKLEARKIVWTQEKTGKALKLPINECLYWHLRMLQSFDHGQSVFGFKRSPRLIYDNWKALQAFAGITDLIEFRDLRESCASEISNLGNLGAATAAPDVLGHKMSGVTDRYYALRQRNVATAIEMLPMPPAALLAAETARKLLTST